MRIIESYIPAIETTHLGTIPMSQVVTKKITLSPAAVIMVISVLVTTAVLPVSSAAYCATAIALAVAAAIILAVDLITGRAAPSHAFLVRRRRIIGADRMSWYDESLYHTQSVYSGAVRDYLDHLGRGGQRDNDIEADLCVWLDLAHAEARDSQDIVLRMLRDGGADDAMINSYRAQRSDTDSDRHLGRIIHRGGSE